MKEKPYLGFVILGISMIAIGIALTTQNPAFITFLAAGFVFLMIGIAKSREGKSTDNKEESNE